MSDATTPAVGNIRRLASGYYAIGEWRVMKSTRMGMTLWFAWIDGTLTKNIWHDSNVMTFVGLREAKAHILGTLENVR